MREAKPSVQNLYLDILNKTPGTRDNLERWCDRALPAHDRQVEGLGRPSQSGGVNLSEFPLTYVADPDAVREELDYEEMIALSGMFRRWAIYEVGFTPEQRTGLITWSADLERIAEWVGAGWRAADPPERPLLRILARCERDSINVISLQHVRQYLGLA
jgi:hypothetical protein